MTDLTERYGGRPPSAAAHATVPGRLWWLAVIGLALGVVVFWMFFALNPTGTIEAQTASFSVDEHSATIDARVSAQPGTSLACAVEAQNDRSTSVGFAVVELTASDDAHQVVHAEVRTTQRAALVQVRECWVTGG